MSKLKKPRLLNSNEANALHPMLRVSPRKLNLVAAAIRGKSVEEALAFLAFDRKRISNDVKKLLLSAVANAENNHQLSRDRLRIGSAVVGKSLVLKRIHARAKGRAGRIHKPYSRLDICVIEKVEEFT